MLTTSIKVAALPNGAIETYSSVNQIEDSIMSTHEPCHEREIRANV